MARNRVVSLRTPRNEVSGLQGFNTSLDYFSWDFLGSLRVIFEQSIATTRVIKEVLVTKPYNKTPYELLLGKTPSIGFLRPFGCPVTILNTLDPIGKFDGKADKRFLVGYSVNSKAFGGINLILVQNIDTDDAFDVKENENEVHVSPSSSDKPNKHDEKAKRDAKGKSPVDLSIRVRDLRVKFEEFSINSTNRVNAASAPVTAVGLNPTNSTNNFNVVGPSDNVVSLNFEIRRKSSFVDPSQYPDDPDMLALEDIVYSDDEEDVVVEADLSNLETNISVSPFPTTRVHKYHPVSQIIGELTTAPQTRSMARIVKEQGLQVKQKDDRIFISQDKHIAEILRKFGLIDGKSASNPIDTEKPLLKDLDGGDVDVHIYSMVRNVDSPSKFLMYQRFLQVMINAQIDLSSHTTKYTSPTLTQKAATEEEDNDDDEVSATPTLPSPTHERSPPAQEPIPSPPQAQPAPPSSPPHAQPTNTSMTLLLTLMDTWEDGRGCYCYQKVNAAEPTVFNDEEVTMTMAQTLIKMKVEKMQEKHLDNIKKYQSLKRKPISAAQARKNMIVYLKNMAGYKMQHFKGMTYDQENFKKLRAEVDVLGSHTTQQDTPTVDPTEISEEDVQNMLQIVLMAEFEVEALQVKVHQVSSTTRRYDIYMLAEKDYPLSNVVMTLMLSSRLQVEEDSEVARDLVIKIFLKANQPKSRVWIHLPCDQAG
nr:retrovirus-related Pol polyprotein from transposon TNT 1-94 [Tanacetum cinerariifolium]